MVVEQLEFYKKVYNILVEYGGANPRNEESFIAYAMEQQSHMEWRFGGLLGMGGKCRRKLYPHHYMFVSYYEDIGTSKQEKIAKRINELLFELGPCPEHET